MRTPSYNQPLSTTPNKIRDYPIHKVTSAKYLGVTINQNLSWSKHIDIITCKTNSIQAFLQRETLASVHFVSNL